MDLKNMAGDVLFSAPVATIKELVEDAVAAKVNLQGAYLQGAGLQGADLRDADLQGAYLRGAYLQGAGLQGADLQGAYLQGAGLQGADLQGAYLRGADLQGADLLGAYLLDAYLRGADLQGADLQGADLRDAYLRGADLQGADLQGADLRDAYLRGAYLRDADLQGAYLRGAYLQGAYLLGAKNIPEIAEAQSCILPEGILIGWKKCQNDVIVKVMIPQKVKRSNATGRKCRASEVKVLQVFGATEGISQHDATVVYRKGETVKCDKWDDTRWNECSGGIHFFLTRVEAEQY